VLLLDLKDVGRYDVEIAGGKGANLGELIRVGFPVPRGFVVTTAAYDRFVAHNQLEENIARALSDQPGAGATIRAAMENARIPPEVQRRWASVAGRCRTRPSSPASMGFRPSWPPSMERSGWLTANGCGWTGRAGW